MNASTEDEAAERCKYMRIANKIRKDITDRSLAVGTKLPPEHVLAPKFDVTKQTLRRALNLLRMEGYLKTTQGIGTYVVSADPSAGDPREHFDLTMLLIDTVRDAIDELEAHLHKTVNRPTR